MRDWFVIVVVFSFVEEMVEFMFVDVRRVLFDLYRLIRFCLDIGLELELLVY